MEDNQASTNTALSNLKTRLDTLPHAIDTPVQRNASSTSLRSMTPADAVAASPPLLPSNAKPHAPSSPLSSAVSALSLNKSSIPPSPTISAAAFPLPDDKKDHATTGRERGSFSETRGNWGNRIVLTTYPGQSNVGMSYNLTILN
jgi:hypothetical protein